MHKIVLLHSMIGYWHHNVICPSVCLSVTLCSVHCSTQRCRELKVVGRYVFGTYKVDERHIEAEIAETVADVPQYDLRPLSYV